MLASAPQQAMQSKCLQQRWQRHAQRCVRVQVGAEYLIPRRAARDASTESIVASQAAAAELIIPDKELVIPKYCESIYQTRRRPTRTVTVRLPCSDGCRQRPSWPLLVSADSLPPHRLARSRSAASTGLRCRL